MPDEYRQAAPRTPRRGDLIIPPSNSRSKPAKKKASAPKPKATGWLGYLSLILLSIIAFSPIVGSELLWSSYDEVERSSFQSMGSWTEAWSIESIRYDNPIATSSYFLEGLLPMPDAITHRAINLLLHILAAIILLRVLESLELPGALAAALVFALHPAVVQPIFWSGYRTELIGLIFILLSIKFGVRNRSSTDLLLMLALTTVASILHPAALALPIIIALCIFYKKKSFHLEHYNRLLPAVCLVLFIGIWTNSGRPEVPKPEGLDQLTLTGANVYHFIKQSLAPFEVSLFYPFSDGEGYSVGARNSLLPFLLFVPFYILVAVNFRKRWARGLLLGLTAFLLMLLYGAARMGQFVDGTPAQEDYGLYIALPFLLGLVVCGLAAFFQSIGPGAKILWSGMIGILVLIQLSLTSSYTYAISDTTNLWNSLAEQWPESAAAKTALIDSVIVTESDLLSEVEIIHMLEKILDKSPDQHAQRIMLARSYRSAGQNTNALREYRRILRDTEPTNAFLEETAELFDKLGLNWEANNVRERIK